MMFEMFATTASYVQILSIAEMIETEAGQSLVTNALSLCQVTINFMQSKVKTMLHSLDDKNTFA